MYSDVVSECVIHVLSFGHYQTIVLKIRITAFLAVSQGAKFFPEQSSQQFEQSLYHHTSL